MRRLLSLVLLLVGCSCGSSETPPPGTTPVGSESGGGEPSGPTTYSVHEWGLVRAGAGDTLVVGAMGPAAPPEALMAVEKPILYFHLSGGGPLELTSVTVDALGGTIVEHWPHTGGVAAPATITWTGLRLERGTCPLAVPTAADRPCSDLSPGSECESPALARAVASDADCVRGASSSSPLLFYRSTSTALTAPLHPYYLDFNDINVTNDGDLPIPGRLIRFQREGSEVRVVVVDPPAPHTTILVGHDFGGPEVARAAVTETLTGLGLTAAEASAFLTSWDSAFFGAPTETPVVERAEIAVEESPPPEESILYFLPAEDVERIAHLGFDPPPTEVRRAMAVWTALR